LLEINLAKNEILIEKKGLKAIQSSIIVEFSPFYSFLFVILFSL
jgi:hypothetical protein